MSDSANFMRNIFPEKSFPRIDTKSSRRITASKCRITDSTFRESQQRAVPFPFDIAIELYKLLSSASGCDGAVCESDFFIYDKHQRAIFDECRGMSLKNITPYAWLRADKNDIYLAESIGVRYASILMPCSDYQISLKLRKTRKAAISHYKNIAKTVLDADILPKYALEDITRADIKEFVIPLMNELLSVSDKIPIRFRLCDTLGLAMPFSGINIPRGIPDMISIIKKEISLSGDELEWHGHNDMHLSLANALAAWFNGVTFVNASILGAAERSGIAPLETLLFHRAGMPGADAASIDRSSIKAMVEIMQQKLNFNIDSSYPVFGREYNTLSSGIHADGFMKNEETYYPLPDYGKKTVRITPHSGLSGIALWINQHSSEKYKIKKDTSDLKLINEHIKKIYENGRTTELSDDEILLIVKMFMPSLNFSES